MRSCEETRVIYILTNMDYTEFTNQTQVNVVVLYDDVATIFAATCAILFCVVGVLGNLITIVALAMNPKLRGHATTAFVLSLCISDLLFCTFSMPLTAVRYINKAWTMGETLCKIFPVIFYANVAFSLLSMVCITLNRYILIAYNSLYNRIYRPTIIGAQLLFIWLFSFGIMVPPLLGVWGTVGLDEPTFSCTILKKDGRSIKKFLFFIGFFLPCVVIICSYSCIYWTVRRQRQKLNRHFDQLDSHQQQLKKAAVSASVPSTAAAKKSNKRSSRDREDSRLTGMMLTIFLCFLVCFLPLTLVNVADDQNRYPWLQVLASVMAWASSVINPFVYAASNRTYRIAYYKLFADLKCWGAPLPPVVSKSYQPSKDSGGGAGVQIKEHVPIANNGSLKQSGAYAVAVVGGQSSATSSLGDNPLLP